MQLVWVSLLVWVTCTAAVGNYKCVGSPCTRCVEQGIGMAVCSYPKCGGACNSTFECNPDECPACIGGRCQKQSCNAPCSGPEDCRVRQGCVICDKKLGSCAAECQANCKVDADCRQNYAYKCPVCQAGKCVPTCGLKCTQHAECQNGNAICAYCSNNGTCVGSCGQYCTSNEACKGDCEYCDTKAKKCTVASCNARCASNDDCMDGSANCGTCDDATKLCGTGCGNKCTSDTSCWPSMCSKCVDSKCVKQ
eukprot:NODE_6285_length_861_cov_93.252033_g6052_i0.p1 GENE.NODE_6285_length_861_cov_93.252033_g6052_i0~~NODE_6285_length_861_cov_93.252033_g6052_i0.p1  ORF type:complete len:269 (-),score=39.04 NODE_6285_length_861_cov_93.252033_g6052_i0:55-807(-)